MEQLTTDQLKERLRDIELAELKQCAEEVSAVLLKYGCQMQASPSIHIDGKPLELSITKKK